MNVLRDSLQTEGGTSVLLPYSSPFVEVRVEGPLIVARIVGESVLFQPSVIREIGAALKSLAQAHTQATLAVDLGGVSYASSEAVAMLVNLRLAMETDRRRLVLCGVNPVVFDAFHLLRIWPYFEIAAGVNEVRAGLSSPPAAPNG